MICGSESMTFELKKILKKLGSSEGSTKVQGGLLLKKHLQKIMIKLIYFDFNFWRIDILRLSLSHSNIP